MKSIAMLGVLISSLVWTASATSQDNPRPLRRRGSNFERLDKNGDGKISRDEFPGPPRFFDRLDANGDGYISPAEASRFRRGRRRPALGENLVRALDTNGDGKVSRQEFAGIVDLFAQLDRDGDGALTSNELTALARVRQPPGGLDIDALFERYDADHDQKLSAAELNAAPQFKNPRFFTMLDQDQDGFVTKDELRTFVRQHQSRPRRR